MKQRRLSIIGAMLWLLAGFGIGANLIVVPHQVCGMFLYADRWYCHIGNPLVSSDEKPEWLR